MQRRLLCAALLLASCGMQKQSPPNAVVAPGTTHVLALAEYPFECPWNHELSGIAWDETTAALLAVSDDNPQIFSLKPAPDFRDWSVGETYTVRAPELERWDGEGIARYQGGFLVANERPPAVLVLDATGAFLRRLPLPTHFARCRSNRCLESLTVTRDERFLFTANEAPLDGDGPEPTFEQRGRIRILRTELPSMKQAEFAYETERVTAPGPRGEIGVPDIVAVSSEAVLVLERCFVPPDTLDIRVYRADLRGARDVLEEASLANAVPVPKKLLVNLSTLEPGGPKPPASGYRVLSNYEGMALGPRLPNGRVALFLVSDDNARPVQTRRLLTLAVPADAL